MSSDHKAELFVNILEKGEALNIKLITSKMPSKSFLEEIQTLFPKYTVESSPSLDEVLDGWVTTFTLVRLKELLKRADEMGVLYISAWCKKELLNETGNNA